MISHLKAKILVCELDTYAQSSKGHTCVAYNVINLTVILIQDCS